MKLGIGISTGRSQTRSLRSAERVTNGQFATGTSGWAQSGGTASWSAGTMRITGDGANNFPYMGQELTNLIVGHEYEITFRLRSDGVNVAQLYARPIDYNTTTGEVVIPNTLSTTFVSRTVKFTATATTLFLRATNGGVPAAVTSWSEFQAISVKEVI